MNYCIRHTLKGTLSTDYVHFSEHILFVDITADKKDSSTTDLFK